MIVSARHNTTQHNTAQYSIFISCYLFTKQMISSDVYACVLFIHLSTQHLFINVRRVAEQHSSNSPFFLQLKTRKNTKHLSDHSMYRYFVCCFILRSRTNIDSIVGNSQSQCNLSISYCSDDASRQ